MNENSSEGSLLNKPLSRRAIITKVPRVALGLWLGWNVTRHEQSIVKNNVFMADGIRYSPLYESHNIGPERSLPDETDGLFIEKNLNVRVQKPNTTLTDRFNIYDLPLSYLVESLPRYDNTIVPAKKIIIEKARDHHMLIGLGDIVPDGYYPKTKLTNPEEVKQFWGGVAMAVLSSVPDTVRKAVENRIMGGRKVVNRRNFLKLSSIVTGSVALSGLTYGSWLATDTAFFEQLTYKPEYPQPFSRLLYTLNGFASDLHPEDPGIFMRNLVMAMKIKSMGTMLKAGKTHPLVAFEVGKAHNGIEYLVGLPMTVLENMILYIHKDFLKASIDQYGDNIAKTRLIKSDEKGEFQDLHPLVNTRLLEMCKAA